MDQGMIWTAFGVIIAALGLIYSFFRNLRIDLNAKFDSIDRRFEAIDRRFDSIDRRFEAIDRRFDSLEKKLDSRIDALEKKFDSRIDTLEKKLEQVIKDVQVLNTRMAVVESKLADISNIVTHLMWHHQTFPPKEAEE